MKNSQTDSLVHEIVTDLEVLTKPSEDITVEKANELKIFEKLEATLDKIEGLGLAAVQIGYHVNAFITKNTETGEYDRYLNPKVMNADVPAVFQGEGCLSLPGKTVETVRYKKIKLADELHEKPVELEGLDAVVLQHEMDHLAGILMTSRVLPTNQKQGTIVLAPKTGRNEPCPCGSEKKYKKCCASRCGSRWFPSKEMIEQQIKDAEEQRKDKDK